MFFFFGHTGDNYHPHERNKRRLLPYLSVHILHRRPDRVDVLPEALYFLPELIHTRCRILSLRLYVVHAVRAIRGYRRKRRRREKAHGDIFTCCEGFGPMLFASFGLSRRLTGGVLPNTYT